VSAGRTLYFTTSVPMAHGAATSMEDAVALARRLAETDRDGVADAFRRYQELRLPRTSKIQLESRQNRWLRQAAAPGWLYTHDVGATSLAAGTAGVPA
jgi:2-polyprenyl-6-methoxyphenol hydroxylase-like FAD-dependent oxidoreductase